MRLVIMIILGMPSCAEILWTYLMTEGVTGTGVQQPCFTTVFFFQMKQLVAALSIGKGAHIQAIERTCGIGIHWRGFVMNHKIFANSKLAIPLVIQILFV